MVHITDRYPKKDDGCENKSGSIGTNYYLSRAETGYSRAVGNKCVCNHVCIEYEHTYLCSCVHHVCLIHMWHMLSPMCDVHLCSYMTSMDVRRHL